MSLEQELRAEFGDAVARGCPDDYLTDFSRLAGNAEAVVLPSTAEEVAAVLAWCYERDVPITPRGGGTGVAGGASPDGGIVVALDRLDRVRSFEPELWRINVEAGVTTGRLQELVRQSGVMFAPDPGAPEQSQIGGNVATNAGGPHAFKYGVVGDWVTGLEAALPPGELVTIGGPIRKDVAGYDLKHLLVGSEGTLGIITAVWLKLLPAPEAVLPVAIFHSGRSEGCAALADIVSSGIVPAALEVLDAETLAFGGASFPGGMPEGAGFLLLAEADGSREEAERVAAELVEVAGAGAVGITHRETAEGIARCGAGGPAWPLLRSRSGAAWSPRTSSSRSSMSRRRWRRRSPSAGGTTSSRSRSATRATGTSTRRSWSTRRTPRSSAGRRRASRSCSSWR